MDDDITKFISSEVQEKLCTYIKLNKINFTEKVLLFHASIVNEIPLLIAYKRKNRTFNQLVDEIFVKMSVFIAYLPQIEAKNGEILPIFTVRLFDYFAKNNRTSIIDKYSNFRLFEYSNRKL